MGILRVQCVEGSSRRKHKINHYFSVAVIDSVLTPLAGPPYVYSPLIRLCTAILLIGPEVQISTSMYRKTRPVQVCLDYIQFLFGPHAKSLDIVILSTISFRNYSLSVPHIRLSCTHSLWIIDMELPPLGTG